MGILLDAYYSLLGDKTNKTKGKRDTPQEDGQASELLPIFDVKKSDEEILSTAKQWKASWESSDVKKQIIEKGDICFDYWKGKQHFDEPENNIRRPLTDNIIFESVETFLPIATRRNPEPVVTSDGTEEGEALAKKVKQKLVCLADILNLKDILKGQTRQWTLRFIGFIKVGWDYKKNEITLKVVKSNKVILDPNAFIESGEYNGEYIGEIRDEFSAEEVINRFEKFPGFGNEKKEAIKGFVSGKMGTKLAFTEWWTPDYVFWTCKGILLGKANNPHWNYGEKEQRTNEHGVVYEVDKQGANHFTYRQVPYIGLTIFNAGTMPCDETSLVWQGIPLQDLINKRLKQIDRNADNVNAGVVVSGDYFTKEEAAEVGEALRRGATLYVPSGDVNVAYKRDIAPSLPPYIYQSVQDYRQRFMDMFGVRGSTPSGIENEQTVRGKILARGSDDSRIGGGISEYLEKSADKVFNWFVQMMYVYYDEEHIASFIGDEKAVQFISLKSSDFGNHKLFISVKEGSLIPTDDLTKRNEAMDLWAAGAIDPITLFERLNFPNPRESVQKLVQWQISPQSFMGPPQEQQQILPENPIQEPLQPPEEQAGQDIISQIPLQ